MSNQKIDFIRKYKIKEPEIDYGEGIASVVQKIAVRYADEIDEFLADAIIKSLPEDISELFIINKKEVLKVILRDVPQKPLAIQEKSGLDLLLCGGKIKIGICKVCGRKVVDTFDKFCGTCGHRVDWSTDD